jgi:hypothetical protein
MAGSRVRFSVQRFKVAMHVAVFMVLLVGALLLVVQMVRESWAFN